MRLTRLDLTNFRGLRETHVDLDDRFILITGENGIGKTAVLDATRTMLAKLWRETGIFGADRQDFSDRDITLGQQVMEARLSFELSGQRCQFMATERRQNAPENLRYEGGLTNKGKETATIPVKDQARLTADPRALSSEEGHSTDCSPKELLQRARPKPLAIFYSTRRSLYEKTSPNASVVKNTATAPYRQALSSRALKIVELATWWNAEKEVAERLNAERTPQAARNLNAMRSAATRIVDDLTDIDAVEHDGKPPTLVATKNGTRIDVQWLSDGERSLLALALDITRRLAQNNPWLQDPVKNGRAVVLIDELDLHLHPSWQRIIPSALTETFESCQFICTTHSPQVVGEVPAAQVRKLFPTGVVDGVTAAKGQDYNYLLETVFGDEDRNPASQALLDLIFENLQRRLPFEAEKLIKEFEREYSSEGIEINRARARLARLIRTDG